ncbi:MAG: hypothetical protein R3D03_05685 [Geminicoccaceae bacterium]
MTRQEWKLLSAEKRLRTVRQHVWMAADDRERRRREHPSAGALAVIVADVEASHPDDSADESGSGAGDQRLAALADGDDERSFGGGLRPSSSMRCRFKAGCTNSVSTMVSG